MSYHISTDIHDLNHAQLLQNETIAIISDRTASQIVRYNVKDETIEWICGKDGTVTMYDAAPKSITH